MNVANAGRWMVCPMHRATNQKVIGSIPVPYDIVSLGKALHLTSLGEMSLYLLDKCLLND